MKKLIAIFALSFPSSVLAYTIQGNLVVTGSNFSVGTSTLTTSNGNVTVGQNLTAVDSVTASAFFGDASHLTGQSQMSVPAGNLINGPLASSILPSTVAYTSAANNWTSASGNSFAYGVEVGSLTISGSGGTVITGSSITASAFFGDASHLSNVTAYLVPAGGIENGPIASSVLPSTVAYTTSNNTWTGTNTFGNGSGSGSLTVANASSATFSSGGSVVNQNDATNTNGVLLFSASFSSMTMPSFTSAVTAGAPFVGCVANSTQSITSHGNPIYADLAGSAVPNAAATTVAVLLMDGNYVNGEGPLTGLTSHDYNFTFTGEFGFRTLVAASPGRHFFCWGFISNTSATQDFCNTNGATVSVVGCPWMVYELH